MSLSIEKLSRKIGDKRRQLKSASDSLKQKMTDYESAGAALEDFLSKNTGDLTDEQTKSLDSLRSAHKSARSAVMSASDEVNQIKDDLVDLETDLTIAQSSASADDYLSGNRPATSDRDLAGASSQARVMPPDRRTMENHLGVYFQSLMVSQLDRVDAAVVARDHFRNDYVASAMSAGDHSRGGAFVQGEFADFYIELLAQEAVLRSCGVPTVPIVNGSMEIPKITDGVIGGYRGEQEAITAEELKTGNVTLIPKELSLLVPMTEKLLRTASYSAATMVRNEMVRAGAALEDSKFLRGTAAGAGPTGLRHRAGHVIAFTGSVTASAVDMFLAQLELALQESSVRMTNPWWITSHRVIKYLETLKNTNGFPIFPEVKEGRINRFPFKATNYIPTNLQTPVLAGNGSPTVGYTEIMLLDVAEQIIGDVPGIRFDVSNQASYVVGGTTVNTFQVGQVLFRLQMENDIHTRHEESIAVGADVEWPLA